MSYPTTGTVTLSASGVSAGIPLDPTVRTTSVLLAGTSNITSTSTQGASFAVTIQATLDTFVPGGVTPVWQNISSLSYYLGSSNGANPVTVDGAFLSILGPIAGLRLSSTSALSPALLAAGTTVTLKALQSVTAGP